MRKAAEEYVRQQGDPFKMRVPITPTNMFTLCHRFCVENFEGGPPPKINQCLTYMIRSGRFVISPLILKYRVDLQRAEILWHSLHHAGAVSAADVASLVFGTGDPGDDLYGHVNYLEAVDRAGASAEEMLDEQADMRILGHASIPAPDISFVPTPRRTKHDMDLLLNSRKRSRAPPAHSLSVAPAPMSGLSNQTRALLQRRRENIAASGMPGAASAVIVDAIIVAPLSTTADDYEPI